MKRLSQKAIIAFSLFFTSQLAVADEPVVTWTCSDGYADGGRSLVLYVDEFSQQYADVIQHDQLSGDSRLARFIGVKTKLGTSGGLETQQYWATAPDWRHAFSLTITLESPTKARGDLTLLLNGPITKTPVYCTR
jgi:hypothetical protein